MPYFERATPFAVLVGCFLLVFVPLTALSLIPNFLPWVPYLVAIEGVGLGVTHFFVTLALYLQSKNLDYFASTARNRVIYFVVPALIFVGLALVAAINAKARYPVFTFWLFAAIRLADFYHVGRQSYGMLQIWKRPAGGKLSSWQRPAENVFFVGMALMQLQSYLTEGRFQGDRMSSVVPAVALGVLFVALCVTYLRAADHGLGQDALKPLSYFAMQATCAAAAVYQTRLYLIALVLHYAEYHLIMAPRCFYAPLDTRRRTDRVSAFLRSRALLFYALLLLVVLLFEGRNHVPAGLSPSTLFLIHIFDGIFLVHYFVEAFLWRFRNPHYRQALGPLYFRPWKEVAEEARRAASPPGLGLRSGLSLAGGLALALAIAQAQGVLPSVGSYLKRTVGDPLYAEQQLEFGLRLANRGELGRAREHLAVALEHDPTSARARSLLHEVERHLGREASR